MILFVDWRALSCKDCLLGLDLISTRVVLNRSSHACITISVQMPPGVNSCVHKTRIAVLSYVVYRVVHRVQQVATIRCCKAVSMEKARVVVGER